MLPSQNCPDSAPQLQDAEVIKVADKAITAAIPTPWLAPAEAWCAFGRNP